MTIIAHNLLCSTRAYHLRIELARMPLLGTVAYNFKKIPTITQDLSRRLIRPFCIMLLYQYLLHYELLLHIMSQYLWIFSLILQGLT